jgi:ribosomal protein S6
MAEISQATDAVQASSQASASESFEALAKKGESMAKDPRPVYEVGFHVVPTIEEAKVADVVDALRSELTKIKAEVITEQFPAKMTLAYIIERAAAGKREKFGETYFGWIKFVVEDRSGINELEGFLQHNKQILRYLLVETVREEAVAPRRTIFTSNRLEGETIKKPTSTPEEAPAEISEEELNKGIDALVG